MRQSVLIASFIFSIFNSSALASRIIITGHVANYSVGETIDLYSFTYYFQSRANGSGNHYSTPVKNGTFTFIIPAASQFQYVSIMFNDTRFINHNVELFLAESEDSISISITENRVSFTGKGAAKYNCQLAVSSLPPISWTISERKALGNSHDFNYLWKVKEKYDSLFENKIKLLNTFSQQLKPKTLMKIRLDIEAEKLLTLFQSFYFYLTYPAQKKERDEQLRFYTECLFDKGINDAIDPGLLVDSKFYTDWLLGKIMLDLLICEHDSFQLVVPLEEILEVIKEKYSGLLQEKLLITAILKYAPKRKDGRLIIEKNANLIHDLHFKALLEHCKGMTRGAPAFEFSLPDENANMVNVRSFKNKTIIMDFWFTGCTFSKDGKKGLKDIKRSVRDTNLVFISVCIDKKRDVWINSLKDTSYNIPGFLNLYTGGLGSDHPLLKNYDFQTVPQFLIIDKHLLLFEVQPPIPGTSKNNQSFLDLIYEAELIE